MPNTCSFFADYDDLKDWGVPEGYSDLILNKGLETDGTVWKCPHQAINNNEYCIFHSETDNIGSDLDETEAVLEAIKNSAEGSPKLREFVGANIDHVDLKRENIDTDGEHPIYFIGSTIGHLEIHGDLPVSLNAEFTEIEREVDLRGVDINGNLSFKFSDVNGLARFDTAEISGNANFDFSKFTERVRFDQARIKGTVSFCRAKIGGTLSFRGATLEDNATFDDAQIDADAKFTPSRSLTHFGGEASFKNITVEDSLDMSADIHYERIPRQDSEKTTRKINFDHPPDFSDADIAGANLSHSDVEGADFRGATLTGTRGNEACFNNSNFASADLSESDLSDADLSDGNLEKSDLTDADLDGTDLSGTNLERAKFSRADMYNTDISDARIEGAALGNVLINERAFENYCCDETRDINKGKLNRIRQILAGPTGHDSARCVYDPKNPSDYPKQRDAEDIPESRASSVYRQLEKLAAENGLSKWQHRFFVLRRDMQTFRMKRSQGTRGIGYWFALIQRSLIGYGESFKRVLGWSAGIILLFSLLYLIGGWIYPVGPQGRLGSPIALNQALDTPSVIWESLYYSTLTFTSLGFGDFRPIGIGQLLTVAETSSGAILLALLVFVFGRRASR